MIYYDWMGEGWVDEDDDNFFVDMTPEGGIDDPKLNQEFDTREDFFAWYFDGFESEEEIQECKYRKNNFLRKD